MFLIPEREELIKKALRSGAMEQYLAGIGDYYYRSGEELQIGNCYPAAVELLHLYQEKHPEAKIKEVFEKTLERLLHKNGAAIYAAASCLIAQLKLEEEKRATFELDNPESLLNNTKAALNQNGPSVKEFVGYYTNGIESNTLIVCDLRREINSRRK